MTQRTRLIHWAHMTKTLTAHWANMAKGTHATHWPHMTQRAHTSHWTHMTQKTRLIQWAHDKKHPHHIKHKQQKGPVQHIGHIWHKEHTHHIGHKRHVQYIIAWYCMLLHGIAWYYLVLGICGIWFISLIYRATARQSFFHFIRLHYSVFMFLLSKCSVSMFPMCVICNLQINTWGVFNVM